MARCSQRLEGGSPRNPPGRERETREERQPASGRPVPWSGPPRGGPLGPTQRPGSPNRGIPRGAAPPGLPGGVGDVPGARGELRGRWMRQGPATETPQCPKRLKEQGGNPWNSPGGERGAKRVSPAARTPWPPRVRRAMCRETR
ncbi:hypothetical protein NDU88_007637 [Pleurodeles waltl]|uniref:Uncharacterized protein n=1 Tax=Pleurodeles waltl TaxID=8319 RepID=A0AAV7PPJ4_PLEWA|nr:hypothetical protein NDU88_007637 [Pleurodeles waltl]